MTFTAIMTRAVKKTGVAHLGDYASRRELAWKWSPHNDNRD